MFNIVYTLLKREIWFRNVFLLVFVILEVFFLNKAAKADEPKISYQIGWSQPNLHLLKISMLIDDWTTTSVQVRIPAWRPGHYVIQNYTKNVVNFHAEDEAERPLSFKKLDKGSWLIEKKTSQSVVVKYDYYARQLDGGSSYLDDSEAYINPITCLMYVPGKELRPVSLTIEKPENWNIVTALEFDENERAFVSENYHELVDSPILISPSFKLLSFEYGGATFKIALQGEGNYKEENLVEDICTIVAEQTNIMQDIPFKRYIFMYHLFQYPFKHGVEHKNSTSIVVGPTNFDNKEFYEHFLGITSHEFFHAWNVERIRPQSIYWPDYSRENYTTTLWMHEGMTSYYSSLTLVRTNLIKKKRYFEKWARIIKKFQNSYSHKVASVDEISWDCWTKNMRNAPPNTYYSFYRKGKIIALLLDLEVRHRTNNNKSLDDVMNYLNRNYAQKNRGLPENGVERAVEKVVGQSFKDFFDDYVRGTAEIDYNQFLNFAGIELITKHDEKDPEVYLGIITTGDEKRTRIRNVIPNTPAYKAGLDLDDILVAIDGKRAHNNNLNLLLKKYKVGDKVRVTVFRRDTLCNFKVVLRKAPPRIYEIKEIDQPSELQLTIRKSWLNEVEEDGKK